MLAFPTLSLPIKSFGNRHPRRFAATPDGIRGAAHFVPGSGVDFSLRMANERRRRTGARRRVEGLASVREKRQSARQARRHSYAIAEEGAMPEPWAFPTYEPISRSATKKQRGRRRLLAVSSNDNVVSKELQPRSLDVEVNLLNRQGAVVVNTPPFKSAGHRH